MESVRGACAKQFSSYSKEKGEELARDGRVIIVVRGPPSFVARVDEESVALEEIRGSPRLVSRCTCRIFALGLDGCRHIWALVAWLEDHGLLRCEALGPGFGLVPKHPPSARHWVSVTELRRTLFNGSGFGAEPQHRRRRGGGAR